MAKSRDDNRETEGWIVRHMAHVAQRSKSWPAWVHSVHVRPHKSAEVRRDVATSDTTDSGSQTQGGAGKQDG
jgi:hypothetical protein